MPWELLRRVKHESVLSRGVAESQLHCQRIVQDALRVDLDGQEHRRLPGKFREDDALDREVAERRVVLEKCDLLNAGKRGIGAVKEDI